MKGWFFLLMFVAVYATPFFGQTAESEEEILRKQLGQAQNDTARVNAMNALTRQLIITGDFDSALVCNARANALAQTAGFKRGLAVSYTHYGLVFFAQGNYPEAIKNYYTSMHLREQLG